MACSGNTHLIASTLHPANESPKMAFNCKKNIIEIIRRIYRQEWWNTYTKGEVKKPSILMVCISSWLNVRVYVCMCVRVCVCACVRVCVRARTYSSDTNHRHTATYGIRHGSSQNHRVKHAMKHKLKDDKPPTSRSIHAEPIFSGAAGDRFNVLEASLWFIWGTQGM